MAADQGLTALLHHISSQIETHDSEIAENTVAAMKAAKGCPVVKSPQHVVQCNEMDVLLRQSPSTHLSVLASAWHAIHWTDSGGTSKPATVQSRLAFAELIGPSGMILNDHCRVGLFLQCAHTHYPYHKHAAEELFLVLSGTARWQRDSRESSRYAPGSFIHHDVWEGHAMTTESEPLLAVWCWTGDIRFGQYELNTADANSVDG